MMQALDPRAEALQCTYMHAHIRCSRVRQFPPFHLEVQKQLSGDTHVPPLKQPGLHTAATKENKSVLICEAVYRVLRYLRVLQSTPIHPEAQEQVLVDAQVPPL